MILSVGLSMPSVHGLDGSLGPVGLHARLTRPRNYEEMPQTREQVQGLNGNHAFDGLLSSTALLAWVLTASKASNAVAAIMVRSPMRMSASSPPVYSNLSTTWRQEKRERERVRERERELFVARAAATSGSAAAG